MSIAGLGQLRGGIGGVFSSGPWYSQSQHYCTGCGDCMERLANTGQMYYQTTTTDNTDQLQQNIRQYIQQVTWSQDVQVGKPPKRKFRGKVVTYMGEKTMQGYSMGEYNLYEVAAIVLPSKKGDFEGEGAKSLTFGESKDPVMLIVAPNADAAVVRASKMINEEYAVERLKVFVRPFVVDE